MAIKPAQRYRAYTDAEKADRNQKRGEEKAWDSIGKDGQITKDESCATFY